MTIHVTCHCGSTKIELPNAPESVGECNCTFCAKSGALWGYYDPGEVKIVSSEHDKVYSATGLNLHHFCDTCGGNTYGDSPNWASLYNDDGTLKEGVAAGVPTARIFGVNMRLADDFDVASVAIRKMDGRNSW